MVGEVVQRIDAKGKVSGRTLFPSDLWMDGMLWVEVVRSVVPHAKIKSIDVSRAEAAEGVARVLTANDVPGLNAFGIQVQDMPVLCKDFVRYAGDAVALVGAGSKEQARRAASMVKVDLIELEPVWDPELAMSPACKPLHPGGNVLHARHFHKGDCGLGFQKAERVFEQVYQAQMMDHAFLETEAGLCYYDEDGLLTVESCGQSVFRDRLQIARALGLPLEQVRVKSPALGGGFGGKDEITVQIYLALMTYHTKRPSKIVLDRVQSMLSHTKRHPVKMYYKTGVTKSGKLTALQARIIADTGAYASLGPAVLDVMVEHAAGPYFVPNVKIDAFSVYTNNGFSGAFRGFGCTQAAFAMESQMGVMARALRMDPLKFRLQNVLHQNDTACLGNRMEMEVGAEQTLQAARAGRLYSQRRRLRKNRTGLNPYKAASMKKGVGVACTMKSCGLGAGVIDQAGVRLRLHPDGRITVSISTTEMGQGCHSVFQNMVASRFDLPAEKITLVSSDTLLAPDSGPTSASRSTFAVGRALMLAADKLESCLFGLARRDAADACEHIALRGHVFEIGNEQIELEALLEDQSVVADAVFPMPEAEVTMTEGMPHRVFSYATHVCLVQVDTMTGEVTLEAIEAYLECGNVVDMPGLEGQSEGGIAQGLGYALFEEVLLDRGRFVTTNFDRYVLPSSLDVPESIRTVAVMRGEVPSPHDAKGAGEIVTVGVAPAIINAIEDALGIRFYTLPVRPEHILNVLEADRE